MNWNPFTWFRSEETVVAAESEAPEVEQPAAEPEVDPILEAHRPNGKHKEHDARATAAEEALAEVVAEMESDNFEERVQNISMGTESLSQEQVQSILKSSRLNSKPI